MVGRRLVPRLLESGYQVSALVRDAASASDLQAQGADLSVGDLAVPESVVPALDEADIVVHTAAHVGDWGPPEKYRAINVVALEKLVTAAQRIGRLQRWIQISSLGVYGSQDHYGTDESQPIVVRGIDGYTQTKAEAEVVLRRYMEEWQFPAVVLRPGFIYGPAIATCCPA
jgi:nucleoside-diphosphate-sugar epimerase